MKNENAVCKIKIKTTIFKVENNMEKLNNMNNMKKGK